MVKKGWLKWSKGWKLCKKNWNLVWLMIWGIAIGLNQLGRVAITSEISFYGHEVIMLLWIGVNLVVNGKRIWQKSLALKKEKLSRIRRIDKILAGTLLGIGALGWLGAILSGLWQWRSLLYVLRLGTYLFFGYLLWLLKPIKKEWLTKIWLGINMIWLVFGWGQMLFLPDMSFMENLGWDEHRYRMVGSWFDPAFFGLALSWFLLMAFSFKDLIKEKWLKWSLVLLASGGLILTYSRAAYLALGAGTLILGTKKWQEFKGQKKPNKKKSVLMDNWQKKVGIIIICLGCFWLGWSLIPKYEFATESTNLLRTSTIFIRIEETRKYLTGFKWWQLLIGKGVYITESYEPSWLNDITSEVKITAKFGDNIFLTSLGFGGILGTLILIYFGTKIIMWSWKNDPLLCAILGSWLIHGQFCNSWLQPFVILDFIIIFLILKSGRQSTQYSTRSQQKKT